MKNLICRSIRFSSFQQLTINKWSYWKKCLWMNSNPSPLVAEATDLPTVPQPLPITMFSLPLHKPKLLSSNSDHWLSVILLKCSFILHRLRDMLKHPLLEAFLQMKWHLTKKYFYVNCIFYMCFLASLTTLAGLQVAILYIILLLERLNYVFHI